MTIDKILFRLSKEIIESNITNPYLIGIPKRGDLLAQRISKNLLSENFKHDVGNVNYLPFRDDLDENIEKSILEISPEDMKFSVTQPNGQIFDRMLNKTSSHTNMSSIPGKSVRLLVTETTTNTIVGFIRLGSPVINSKPRNVYLGRPLQTTDMTDTFAMFVIEFSGTQLSSTTTYKFTNFPFVNIATK